VIADVDLSVIPELRAPWGYYRDRRHTVASRYAMTEEITSGKVAVGQFEPARVDRSRDVYTEYMQLKRRVPGDELYTNDLLTERK
jgi:hypothetical protein